MIISHNVCECITMETGLLYYEILVWWKFDNFCLRHVLFHGRVISFCIIFGACLNLITILYMTFFLNEHVLYFLFVVIYEKIQLMVHVDTYKATYAILRACFTCGDLIEKIRLITESWCIAVDTKSYYWILIWPHTRIVCDLVLCWCLLYFQMTDC